MARHTGAETVVFSSPVCITATASTVGTKEGEGPLGKLFDRVLKDNMAGEQTWEAAESVMVKDNFGILFEKSGVHPDFLIAGDLQNQCCGTNYGVRDLNIPTFGVFDACATFGEALALAAVMTDSGAAENVAAGVSSHFCSAERQFRFPLELGNQRPPTSTYTVTGAGAAMLSKNGTGPYITAFTAGKITDYGVNDANNMGAAMAPAAAECISMHLRDTGRNADYYDLIATGDLGCVGRELLLQLLKKDGTDIADNHMDCGIEIFDKAAQDTHAGGSGCACSAAVFAALLYKRLKRGELNRLLLVPTGALMSPTSIQEGESILGTAYAVAIENEVIKWNI
ncbi:MAG: stage V sporulation protein AD [Firmicutes bacterium]|nr:stage V sporulation protein AD [Bacillota bacterium]